MLPRVALEYGQIWWALNQILRLLLLHSRQRDAQRDIQTKPPSERGPMPTFEVMEVSAGNSELSPGAGGLQAPMKQAA